MIILDGEAMAHCKDGLPDFHGLRSGDGGAGACLFAFDLLRLNGEDLRPLPLEERRARLRKALRGAGKGHNHCLSPRAQGVTERGLHREPATTSTSHSGVSASASTWRRRSTHLPPRLRARAGGHRLQAPGCALQVRPEPYVAEDQPDYAH
jgi:hypothetical protein